MTHYESTAKVYVHSPKSSFLQVYSEEPTEGISEGNTHFVFKLQSSNWLDTRGSNGSIQHAGLTWKSMVSAVEARDNDSARC